MIFLLVACTAATMAESVDSAMVDYLQSEHGVTTYKGNRVRLFYTGEEKFRDMFAAIRSAHHSVNLEYFNFRNDSIAGALFDLLAQKAAEGVKVRALYDAFGNSSNNRPLKKHHLDSLRSRGVEIYEYDPLTFPWLNHIFHRDHRKIVVIDGKIAYTGGMNVADYYVNGLPEIGDWHDRHLCVEGPVVALLQRIFFKMWWRQTREMVVAADYYPAPDYHWIGADAEDVRAAVVNREPCLTPAIMRRTMSHAIDLAESHVQIVNPYFVPTRSVMRALKRALRRGVEVEILIAAKSDIPFTPDASFCKLHRLMKRGAKVYVANNGFHHSKIMMIDGRFSTVGSTNLDSRSLRFDFEENLFLFSPALTDSLSSHFEADKRESTLMTPQTWCARSRWRRFVGWFANMLSFCI